MVCEVIAVIWACWVAIAFALTYESLFSFSLLYWEVRQYDKQCWEGAFWIRRTQMHLSSSWDCSDFCLATGCSGSDDLGFWGLIRSRAASVRVPWGISPESLVLFCQYNYPEIAEQRSYGGPAKRHPRLAFRWLSLRLPTCKWSHLRFSSQGNLSHECH